MSTVRARTGERDVRVGAAVRGERRVLHGRELRVWDPGGADRGRHDVAGTSAFLGTWITWR